MAFTKGLRWLVVLLLAVPIGAPAANLTAIEELRRMSDVEMRALMTRAAHKDVRAETLLGLAYMNGVRVPQDAKQAANWLTRAAKHGQPVAENNLGLLCYQARDFDAAFKWFKASSSTGHVPALFNLGTMYFKGVGVKQDYSQAAKYLEIAARQGHAKAQNLVGYLYER